MAGEARLPCRPPHQDSRHCTGQSSLRSPVCVPFLVFLAGNFWVCRQEKMKEDFPPSSHVPVSDSKSILK